MVKNVVWSAGERSGEREEVETDARCSSAVNMLQNVLPSDLRHQHQPPRNRLKYFNPKSQLQLQLQHGLVPGATSDRPPAGAP